MLLTTQTDTTDAGTAQEYDVNGMKVVLGCPTYGPVNPVTSKHLRVAIMFAANRGVLWVGDGSPDRMGYGAARNTVAQYTLKQPDADGIVWVDSDIKPAANQIARLLDSAHHNKLDFVSGIYFQREGVHNPVFHDWNADKHCFQPAETFPPNKLGYLERGGCGFGFVYTSTKMLYDMALSKEFDPKTGWFPDRRDVGGFGEDLTFCYIAHSAGYGLWIDSGIMVAHEGNTQYITYEDFLREQKQWHEDNKKEEPRRWGLNDVGVVK